MRGRARSLGRVVGVPMRVDASWVALLAWALCSLALGFLPQRHPTWSPTARWLAAGVVSALLLTSALAHEVAHLVVTRRQGRPPRKITLFVFGASHRLAREPRNVSSEVALALSGPLLSLALSAVFAASYVALRWVAPIPAYVAYLVGAANLVLGLANLFPGYPFDGGVVIDALLWHRRHDADWAQRVLTWTGGAMAYGLTVAGAVWFSLGEAFWGAWMLLLGLCTVQAIRISRGPQSIRELLEAFRVEQVMSRDYALLPAHLSLESFVDSFMLRDGTEHAVAVEGEAVGWVDLAGVAAVSRQARTTTSLADVQSPLGSVTHVSPETTIWSALRELGASLDEALPVLDNGRLVGIVRRKHILRFLSEEADETTRVSGEMHELS